jgi:hypothetical protein
MGQKTHEMLRKKGATSQSPRGRPEWRGHRSYGRKLEEVAHMRARLWIDVTELNGERQEKQPQSEPPSCGERE